MSISFAHKIYSRILNDELWIVSGENNLINVTDDAPVYLMKEIELIENENEKTLKLIHKLKKKFKGEILSESEASLRLSKRLVNPNRARNRYAKLLPTKEFIEMTNINNNSYQNNNAKTHLQSNLKPDSDQMSLKLR